MRIEDSRDLSNEERLAHMLDAQARVVQACILEIDKLEYQNYKLRKELSGFKKKNMSRGLAKIRSYKMKREYLDAKKILSLYNREHPKAA